MPLFDIPQPILFILFLSLFVLFGIYPAWKKTATLLRNALEQAKRSMEPERADNFQFLSSLAPQPETPRSQQLNDFEIFVLRRLAEESRRNLSRKQINANLHLEKPMLKAALDSLLKRGMIRMSLGYFSGIRFRLSAKGHNYAIDCGYIPSTHGPKQSLTQP